MLRPQDNRAISPTVFLSKKTIFAVFLFLGAPTLYFIVGSSSNDGALSEVYASTRYSVDQMRNFAFRNSISTEFKPSYYTRWNYSFSKMLEEPTNKFDIKSNDVIVFIHIQKTAGTSFEKFLVKYLDIERPCQCSKGKKRCTCRRPNRTNEIWLFSRYSTGWVCGLHADFTELFVSGCVDTALDKKEGVHQKRRYFYTSFLRDPISRFISEYRHVNRGATWIASRHVCNGRPPTPDELPLCFDPQVGWDDVSLEEFLHCPFNLAFNRQTRMLADLTLINCYSRVGMDAATRDRIMLESAKNNLRNLAYFGMKERMDDSQYMFEELFGMRFNRKLDEWAKSKSNDTLISDAQMKLIREKNQLDIELYDYAMKLFDKRLKQLKTESQLSKSASSNTEQRSKTVGDDESSDIFFVRDDPLPAVNKADHNDTIQYDSSDSYEVEDTPTHDDNDITVQFKRV